MLLGYYKSEEVKTKAQASECDDIISENLSSTSSAKTNKNDDVNISQNAIVDPIPGTSGQSMEDIPMVSFAICSVYQPMKGCPKCCRV